MPQSDAVVDQGEIVIVSGLPRSGTSMAMSLLEAGGIPALIDGVREADEDNRRGYYEFERVKQVKTDRDWLPDAEGKAVKMVYRLLYDLPMDRSYRVLFMRRKLEEVLASQQIMLERKGVSTPEGEEGQIARLLALEIEKVVGWLREQPNFNVLYVDYNELLTSPERLLGEIDKFFAGRIDINKAGTVIDANQYRNRR